MRVNMAKEKVPNRVFTVTTVLFGTHNLTNLLLFLQTALTSNEA